MLIGRALVKYNHDHIETPVSVNKVLEELVPCHVHIHTVGLNFYYLVLIYLVPTKSPINVASLINFSVVLFCMTFILRIFFLRRHLWFRSSKTSENSSLNVA